MNNELNGVLLDVSIHSIENKPLYDQVSKIMENNSVIMETYISPYETKALIKYITKKPDDIDGWGSKLRSIIGRVRKPSDDITYDDLINKWNTEAQPNDMGEVINILSNSGFSNRVIKRTMAKLGIDPKEGSSPAIDKMGRAIRRANLQEPIIKFLEKSVTLTESITYDNIKLSDGQIKKIFKAVLDVRRVDGDQERNYNYIKQWTKVFNQSVPNEQVRLSIEFINYLKDRMGTEEHKILSDAFISVIRRSNLPEYMIRSMANDVRAGREYTKVNVDMKDPNRDRSWWDGTKYKKQDKTEMIKTPYNYLNNWGAEFNRSNIQNKIQLAKEITNYLADRQGTPEHGAINDIVKKVIRNSHLPNNIIKGIFKRIDRGEPYPIKETAVDQLIVENIFTRVIEEHDLRQYGRAKRR